MICVDASVAAKWILDEEYSSQAKTLYLSTITSYELIVAPVFMIMEVNNALLKRIRKQELELSDAARRLDELRNLPVRLLDTDPLHQQALALAETFRLPAVYDAYYLALAEAAMCPFWTADEKLVNTLDGRLPFVRWIGHFRR